MIWVSIYKICEQLEETTTYSASVVESDTQFCFCDDQLTNLTPRNWHPLEVILWSNMHPTWSESVTACRLKFFPDGYQRHNALLPLRYLRIWRSVWLHSVEIPWDLLGIWHTNLLQRQYLAYLRSSEVVNQSFLVYLLMNWLSGGINCDFVTEGQWDLSQRTNIHGIFL